MSSPHIRYGFIYPVILVFLGLFLSLITYKFFGFDNPFKYYNEIAAFQLHVLFAVGAAIFGFMYPNIISDCIKTEYEKLKNFINQKKFLTPQARKAFDYQFESLGDVIESLRYIKYGYACLTVVVVFVSFVHIPFFILCLYMAICYLYFSAFLCVSYVLIQSRALRRR